jgi:hypothetical protein
VMEATARDHSTPRHGRDAVTFGSPVFGLMRHRYRGCRFGRARFTAGEVPAVVRFVRTLAACQPAVDCPAR